MSLITKISSWLGIPQPEPSASYGDSYIEQVPQDVIGVIGANLCTADANKFLMTSRKISYSSDAVDTSRGVKILSKILPFFDDNAKKINEAKKIVAEAKKKEGLHKDPLIERYILYPIFLMMSDEEFEKFKTDAHLKSDDPVDKCIQNALFDCAQIRKKGWFTSAPKFRKLFRLIIELFVFNKSRDVDYAYSFLEQLKEQLSDMPVDLFRRKRNHDAMHMFLYFLNSDKKDITLIIKEFFYLIFSRKIKICNYEHENLISVLSEKFFCAFAELDISDEIVGKVFENIPSFRKDSCYRNFIYYLCKQKKFDKAKKIAEISQNTLYYGFLTFIYQTLPNFLNSILRSYSKAVCCETSRV